MKVSLLIALLGMFYFSTAQASIATTLLLFYSEHTKQQLLRCDDTAFEAGFYGTYYGTEFHGNSNMCASDVLTSGEVTVHVNKLFGSSRLHINLKGAGPDPFILYEVYWVPMGGNPVDSSESVPSDPSDVGDRILIGNIITDCNHDADDYVRVLNGAADLTTAVPVNPKSLIGKSKFTGHWLLYSRGKQGTHTASTCDAASNVTTPTFTPQLWGGNNDKFDGVQFISGHDIPGAIITSPTEWMNIYNIYD